MFHQVFEGEKFSYFYEKSTDEYMLYWHKYEMSILLKDEDAFIFRQQIEIVNSEPQTDIKARIEKIIKIHFYFKFACPMPQFAEA